MRPSFSRALRWVFKGNRYPWVIDGFNEALPKAPGNLGQKASSAVVHGDAHETTNRRGEVIDPIHVSGVILTEKGGNLSSFHAYPDGRIVFSKKKYGVVHFDPDAGTSDESVLATGLTWRMDEENQVALYWDGTTWQRGQWSGQHRKWIALYDGVWYAWH
ncbi:hypothetical protein QQS21_010855 [Conoideocrella luteorostrata]|uniref:Uncharacterized protein n=1 Tax=Conoideocrella luteorostrata TaxID=1105319 RepID=A0AAJ0FNY5_9HYPO|nr:hypothetical protein QQS21_010855 [Conoideocrella luteorostrata]